MPGDKGYTPEEIAALRSKLVGSSDVSSFDKKASDVSASASRLADHPFVSGILASGGGMSPATPMLRDAVGQASLTSNGGIGDLSKKTQGALADQVTSPGGTILRPLDSPVPDITPAPSLKEQLMAKLQGNTSGGVGGLGGLRAAYLASRRRQIGDFETDKDLAGQQGVNRAVHVDELAALQNAHAQRVQRDAEIQQQADEQAGQKHQAMLARNTELADDIGRQKIDPKRLIKNQGTGERVLNILGSALGGALAARTGGPNQFLERFDKQVAQDIQAQMDEVDNKKASLGARQNIFAQMLAETGDRRLAAMQTRNLMYESAKQHLAAEDAKLGVPEIRTGAQQNIQALQHQQDALQTQFDAEAYQTAQQQAAAAAAAQRAAEKAAWDRQMQVYEMGLKKDELEIKRLEAGKKVGTEDNQAIQTAAKALADDDIVKNRELILSLGRKVDPKTGEVVGLGTGAKLRAGAAKTLLGPASLLAPNVGEKVALSDEERLAQQEFEQLKLLYQTKVTGSGGSDQQMAIIDKAFRGAGSMAEKKHAIDLAMADLKRREGLAMTNMNDNQKAELQRRLAREGQTDMPDSVKVTAGNVSDERAKVIKKKLGGY
jgi:hypothetical protein